MLPNIIQPWGKPFTPLLPRVLLKIIGHQPVPKGLRKVFGSKATLEVLNDRMWELAVHDGKLWDIVDSIDRVCLWQIADLARPALLSHSHLPIRSGEPLTVPIDSLPFSTRVRNVILKNPRTVSAPSLTFNDVLCMSSFGYRSAIEFACVLEAAIEKHPNLNMLSDVVQPWGKPPTPLLPKALAKEVSHIRVPKPMQHILGSDATFSLFSGDLWRISILNRKLWELIDSIDKDFIKYLVSIVGPILSKRQVQHQLIIQSDEALGTPIEALPFSTRIQNIVASNLYIFASPTLTFHDILQSASSFGIRSAIEFASVVESALQQPDKPKHTSPPRISSINQQDTQDRIDTGSSVNHHNDLIHEEIRAAFESLVSYAKSIKGINTFGDVLPKAREDWPSNIKNIWRILENIHIHRSTEVVQQNRPFPSAISHILDSLNDDAREIIINRELATENPMNLESLGKRQGVTRERIRQRESKALRMLRHKLHTTEFESIVHRSQALRQQLGTGLPANDSLIENSLNDAISDLDDTSDTNINLAKLLLLWLAGPYKVQQGWLLAREDIYESALSKLLGCKNDHGLISKEDGRKALEHLGFNRQYHFAWICHLKHFHTVEDGYLYLNGSIPDQALTLIHYYDRPLTAEELIDKIGKGSVRSVRQRLIEDPRFWRINKQCQFVIADTPGYNEYTGIVDEIVQEIRENGGRAQFQHLVDKISKIYGVKENSVIAYLNTPMFIKDDNNVVRIRSKDEEISVSTNISRTPACYKSFEGFWYWRATINSNIIRGSSYLIPNAFAQILGCNIGHKIEIESEHGPINISWPLSSTTGASISSLRHIVSHYDLEAGDYLFVKATVPYISFGYLRNASLGDVDSKLARLCLLLGYQLPDNDDEAIERIATALNISSVSIEEARIESHRLLLSRSETELANMISLPTLSIDEHISNIQKLFER